MRPDWIAVDWGTSNLRAWAMGARGEVLADAKSDAGMGTLKPGPHGFEPALMDLIRPWLGGDRVVDVIACGMVGSRQGWAEAAYRPVPAAPLAPTPVRAVAHDRRIRVHILGGVSQKAPPDVMRGEETQIAGLLTEMPGFEGVIALPGTHTKWVQIVGGEIFHFASYMTGELYALLSRQSVLRHSVGHGGLDDAAFIDALGDTLSHPERVAAKLFGLRAAHLLAGEDPAQASARLSGYLLGLELAGARPYWLGQPIALVAAGAAAHRYCLALDTLGAAYTRHDPDACVRAGLTATHAALTQTEPNR
ncbi:MAG: 2-dehydro-3-deoxygalactonokinase [Pseudomonadota bacterium]